MPGASLILPGAVLNRYVNTDQIVAINAGQNATEVQMANGRTRWIKNTPDDVVAIVKASV